MGINYNEICKGLAAWMATWEFSAFVTLTNQFNPRAPKDIPSSYESKVSNYLTQVEKLIAEPVAAIGLHSLSYAGYLHSHFVVLKKGGQGFSSEELQLFERQWYRQADAQEVTQQDTLLEYIASDKHIQNCRDFDYLIFGDFILSQPQT